MGLTWEARRAGSQPESSAARANIFDMLSTPSSRLVPDPPTLRAAPE